MPPGTSRKRSHLRKEANGIFLRPSLILQLELSRFGPFSRSSDRPRVFRCLLAALLHRRSRSGGKPTQSYGPPSALPRIEKRWPAQDFGQRVFRGLVQVDLGTGGVMRLCVVGTSSTRCRVFWQGRGVRAPAGVPYADI